MKKSLKYISSFLLLLFCLGITVLAQSETAQISGTVIDPNNAVVPGATVTVTSTKTGFTRNTTTNEDGYYIITNLQPSTYEVSIKSGNFQEYKVTREISVGGEVTVNATLSATAGPAVVDVVAGSTDIAEVNTTDQTVSEVVGNKQLQSLPTITRNPYDFIRTVGNVSEGDSGGRGVGVSINGQRAASTNILINGGENVDLFSATTGQTIPLDSVQEYRVTTGTFSADLGRATGGVVNLVTKSGENRFFGSAYVFNRNSKFASAGYDANARVTAQDLANGVQPRQYFNRNQYGFSVGGPIVKNKLLFFTNTEWTKIRSTLSATALVPSAASLAAASANTRNFFSAYSIAGTPTGNQESSTSATGKTLVFDEVRYSVPSDTGAGTPGDGYASANRIDWNISDRFQIYGVYIFDKTISQEGSNTNSPYAGFNTGSTNYNQNIQGQATYSLSSNFVGVSRFTYNRLFNEQPLGETPVGPTLYMRTSYTSVGGVGIALPGYLPFNPGSAIPFGGPQRVYNFGQDFSYNIGDHLLKFGAQYYKIADDRTFGAYANSVQTLGNNLSTAIDNFFAGNIYSFQTALNPNGRFPGQTITLPATQPSFSRNNRYTEYAFYGNDSFKLFPNFTANVGLRYEYYGPQRNLDPNLDSNFYPGGDGTVTPENIRSGSVQIAPNSPIGDLWQKDKNNFAPSVGFAYDITGDGKTSIRAGYALRYERNFGNVTFNVIQNPPNYAVISITGTPANPSIGTITTNNLGPFAGTSGTRPLFATSLRAVAPNIVNSYAHQYSASLERRIGKVTASATYSGTSGRNLYSIANINRQGSGFALLGSNDTTRTCSPTDLAGSTATTRTRLNCQYSDINFRGNFGRSDYQGITFALESGNLFGAGLTMASRYTYSVARDNLSTTFSETGTAFNLGYVDAWDPNLDYGYADFDVRHRWITNFVWDLPTNRYFNNGLSKAVLGGFTLSGIINIQSGDPYSVYDCYNGVTVCTRLIPSGGTLRYAGSLGAETVDSDGNPVANEFAFLDLTNQFSVPLDPANSRDLFPGENGFLPSNMTARNAFRGPGFWNVDLALAKNFAFTERMNLQLRVDAINVFNHANVFVNKSSADIYSLELADSKFVTAYKSGRRQMQFGIRFVF